MSNKMTENYKDHWAFKMTEEELLLVLDDISAQVIEAKKVLKGMMDGTMQPDEGATISEEVMNAAKYLHDIGEAIQAVGLMIPIKNKFFQKEVKN